MSFRSKYHHVFLKQTKDTEWLTQLRPKMNSWDSNHLAVSTKFCAVPYSGGGGCVAVFDIQKFTRIEVHKKIVAHERGVTDCKFSPFNPSLLITGSEDATMRLWSIPEGGVTEDMQKGDSLQEFSGHYKKVGIIGWHPTCENVIISTSVDKTVKLWDVEKGECKVDIPMKNIPLHVDWDQAGNTFVCTARDKKMYHIDPRASEKIVGETSVFGSMKGIRCVYLKDKDLVVCTGFDRGASRTAKLYDMKDLSKPVDRKELDLQAGILMVFYDEDLGILYMGGKGEGMIRYFDTEERKLHQINSYASNIGQRGLCMMHKMGLNTMDHEVGRFFKLTEKEVVPLRVLFPRKSSVFQPDLFPETKGFTATGDASTFFDGGELAPIEKISLEPGKRPEGFGFEQKTTFVKKVAKAVKQEAPYEYWKKEDLIKKVKQLEEKLKKYEQE